MNQSINCVNSLSFGKYHMGTELIAIAIGNVKESDHLRSESESTKRFVFKPRPLPGRAVAS